MGCLTSESAIRNPAVAIACRGRDAARASATGASLIRDRHGLDRSTQVGFTRLAHIGAPISGKPEIGVCKKTGKYRKRTNQRGARGGLWKPHPEEARSAVSRDEASDAFALMLRDAARVRGSSA